MRSDINTLELNKEEKKFIEDYFKYVREKMTFPTHPEISIGAARYPLGRFLIKGWLIRPFVDCRKIYLKDKEAKSFDKMKKMIETVDKLVPIIDDLKKKGKTVKSQKR